MKPFLFAFVFLLSVIRATDNWVPFDTSTFPNRYVSNDGKVVVYYSLSSDKNMVTFGVAAKTVGWVGFSLSDNDGILGAEMAIFYEDMSSNKYVLEDRHVTGMVPPVLEATQNLNLLEGYQETNYKGKGPVTAFKFSWPVQACNETHGNDKFNQHDIDFLLDKSQFLIYAFGSSNNFGAHAPKNAATFLINSGAKTLPTGLTTSELKVTMPSVTVPPNATQYCYSFQVLPAAGPRYAVAEEAIVSSGKVHHIILWPCPQSTFSGNGLPAANFCDADWRSNVCVQMFMVWGVGMSKCVYPETTGKPFGSFRKWHNYAIRAY